MASYRAFLIDRDGHFTRVQFLEGIDDEAAMEEANELTDHHDVEVWHQDRMVGTLKRRQLKA